MSTSIFPTLPSGRVPSSSVFSLISNTQAFTSPLSRSTQTIELPGARWQFSLTYQNLSDADARVLKAFLLSLRGAAGRFLLWDHAHPAPAGQAIGSPIVNGAGQLGTTINTAGWSSNITGLLLAGDYIQLGAELKILTADANSNGTGLAALAFEPPLRTSPGNGSSIIIVKPTAVFRLIDDEQDRFQVAPGKFHDITIAGVEAF